MITLIPSFSVLKSTSLQRQKNTFTNNKKNLYYKKKINLGQKKNEINKK